MKVFYLKPSNSSFVRIDEEILSKNFELTSKIIPATPKSKFLIRLFKLFIYLIFNGNKFDIYYTRFADYHSAVLAFFSRIFKKKLVIVVGGYDVIAIPEFNYGAHLKKFRSFFSTYALNKASFIFPNSKALVKSTNKIASNQDIEVGIKQYAPNTIAEIKVIPNAYKFNLPGFSAEKEDIILTVAIIDNLRTFKIKGIDLYFECAKLFHDKQFVIVGMPHDFIEKNKIDVPQNITIIDKLPHAELQVYYQKAKVFCLFSRTEGMPNVLCEAMLNRCIPVATNVGAVSEIIGNTGYVINSVDISEIKSKLTEALEPKNYLGELASKRILENYTIEQREQKIVSTINQSLF